MDFQTILSIALASLIVFVIAHFAVFWVVKTMYPPHPQENHVTFLEPIPDPPVQQAPQVFAQPPVETQHVTVPTYEAPVPTQTPNKEGEQRRGPPPPESTSIRGDSGVAPPNTQ